MDIQTNRNYAVLTGDIIQSSKLSGADKQKILSALKALPDEIKRMFNRLYVSDQIEILGPSIFRGDSWQMFLSEPGFALRTAFYLRAGLKALYRADTRVAVGIGTVNTPLNNDLSQAGGNAFRFSGIGLDELKTKEHMVCWFHEPSDKYKNRKDIDFYYINRFLNSSLLFASRLADGWSQHEAWALLKALEGLKQGEIASQWLNGEKTTQQNAGKTLGRAGWAEIEHFLNLFRNYICLIQPE